MSGRKIITDFYGVDCLTLGVHQKDHSELFKLNAEAFGFTFKKHRKHPKGYFRWSSTLFGYPGDKKLNIAWSPRKLNDFASDIQIDFESGLIDTWGYSDVTRIILILRILLHVNIGFENLLRIEYFLDVPSLPKIRGNEVIFGKPRARKYWPENRNRKRPGYTEGRLKGGIGSLAKCYLKSDYYDFFRLEVALSKRCAAKIHRCKSIKDLFDLDILKVFDLQSHFAVIKISDIESIIGSVERSRSIRRKLKRWGLASVKNLDLDKRERIALGRCARSVPVSDLIGIKASDIAVVK